MSSNFAADPSDFSAAAQTLPLRIDDRFGVTHVLFAMHSDTAETADFIRFPQIESCTADQCTCGGSNSKLRVEERWMRQRDWLEDCIGYEWP